MTRGKSELLAENALLRQQLLILRRQIKRPAYRKRDRLLLVLLSRMVRTWKQALFLTNYSEVDEARSHHTAKRTELEKVPAQPCGRAMGL
jgi:hypothetical protein